MPELRLRDVVTEEDVAEDDERDRGEQAVPECVSAQRRREDDGHREGQVEPVFHVVEHDCLLVFQARRGRARRISSPSRRRGAMALVEELVREDPVLANAVADHRVARGAHHRRRTAEVALCTRIEVALEVLGHEAARALPRRALAFVREHGDEREGRGPGEAQRLDLVERVEVGFRARAEQEDDGTRDLVCERVFEKREDRREARAPGDGDERALRVAQAEVAERPLDPDFAPTTSSRTRRGDIAPPGTSRTKKTSSESPPVERGARANE